MNPNRSHIRRVGLIATALFASASVITTAAQAGPKARGDFTGAFIVEHVSTFTPPAGPFDPANPPVMIQVDVVGAGCVSGAGRACCDNNGQQFMYPDNSGRAEYTIRTPGGSVVLLLVAAADQSTGNPVVGIKFGGTFTIKANSGTGVYKGAKGSGVWTGGAEFTGPLVPGVNPPGPGRWTFWGTIHK